MKSIFLNILANPLRFVRNPSSVLYPNTWCSEAYVNWLRKCGATIGERTRFISPRNCNVDIGRAQYISIGNDCCLSCPTLLAHDYSWYILAESHRDIIPDGGGQNRYW